LPRAGNLGVQGLNLRAGTRRRTCLSARAEKTENFGLQELSPVMHCGNAARGIGCLIEWSWPIIPSRRTDDFLPCRRRISFAPAPLIDPAGRANCSSKKPPTGKGFSDHRLNRSGVGLQWSRRFLSLLSAPLRVRFQ